MTLAAHSLRHLGDRAPWRWLADDLRPSANLDADADHDPDAPAPFVPDWATGGVAASVQHAADHAVRDLHESGWRRRARCRGRVDLNFYSNSRRQIRACKAVCAPCPVRAACAVEAILRHDPWGVWGGMTPEERDELVTGIPQFVSADQIPHASNTRYLRDGCRCVRCTDAHTFHEWMRAILRPLGVIDDEPRA